MLNIGGGELLIILLVALIFLGPQRLPEVARQVGQTVNTLRGLARGFQAELEAAARPDPNRDLRAWAGDPDEPDEQPGTADDPGASGDSDVSGDDDRTDAATIAAKAREVNHDAAVSPVSDGGPLDLSDEALAAAEADEEE